MILVTGGTGFVGRHLVRELTARNEEVRCLVRDPARARQILPPSVTTVVGDLQDRPVLERALEGVNGVLHLAGLIKASQPSAFHEVNGAGTLRLCDAVRAVRPRLSRFLYVSSLSAAGPSPPGLPRDERDAAEPISHYGTSKLEGEHAVNTLGKDVPITILRPPAVYGPEDPEMLSFFRIVKRGLSPAIGLGARWVSLIHVSDLVRAIVTAQRDAAAGKTYFVSEPEPYTWRQLFEIVRGALGRATVPVIVPETVVRAAAFATEIVARLFKRSPMFNRDKARELCARAWTCRSTRIEAELGFHCETTAPTGIPETIAWYRQHGWL
jgi:nucleoside-diphosphate-sugar epimerase